MNEDKMKKLFEAARNEPAPEPSSTFAQRVISAIRFGSPEPSVLEQLVFPARAMLAPAAALIIAMLAFCYWQPAESANPSAELAELTEQWVLNLD